MHGVGRDHPREYHRRSVEQDRAQERAPADIHSGRGNGAAEHVLVEDTHRHQRPRPHKNQRRDPVGAIPSRQPSSRAIAYRQGKQEHSDHAAPDEYRVAEERRQRPSPNELGLHYEPAGEEHQHPEGDYLRGGKMRLLDFSFHTDRTSLRTSSTALSYTRQGRKSSGHCALQFTVREHQPARRVILSGAKDLCVTSEILRSAQDDICQRIDGHTAYALLLWQGKWR